MKAKTHDNSDLGSLGDLDAKTRRLADHYGLSDMDAVIVKHITLFPELTVTAIARALAVNRLTVNRHLKQPNVKRAIREITKPVSKSIVRVQKAMLERLEQLVEDRNPEIALKACDLVNKYLTAVNVGEGELSADNILYCSRLGDDGVIHKQTIVGGNDVTKVYDANDLLNMQVANERQDTGAKTEQDNEPKAATFDL